METTVHPKAYEAMKHGHMLVCQECGVPTCDSRVSLSTALCETCEDESPIYGQSNA